jgi:hypothetical protein
MVGELFFIIISQQFRVHAATVRILGFRYKLGREIGRAYSSHIRQGMNCLRFATFKKRFSLMRYCSTS